MKYKIDPKTSLKIVAIGASMILGAIIGYKLAIYVGIPVPWKIAMATFILFLPFYFFLQVLLNVNSTEENRVSTARAKMRSIYLENYKNLIRPEPKVTGKDLLNPRDFETMVKQRSELLADDCDLQSTYNKAYEILLRKESAELQNVSRKGLLEFDFEQLLRSAIQERMQEDGTNFSSYLLPLSFFVFTYLAGFLLTIPLITSVFAGNPASAYIPLFKPNYNIPFSVIQWGFLGGFVYTSISLLTRFLRNDLLPRVYLSAGVRLLLSVVVPIVIYFFYMLLPYSQNLSGMSSDSQIFPQILLVCFLAGVAPVQILVNFADTQISRIYKGWKRMNLAGNKPLTQLEGINSITAQRLNEEGIDYIQHMALCDVKQLASKTKLSLKIVQDWKDQAILLILSGDIVVKSNDSKKEYLNITLDKRLGIRRISVLLRILNELNDQEDKQKSFFRGLGLLDDVKNNFDWLLYLFRNITYQGKQMMKETIIEDLADNKVGGTPIRSTNDIV